MASRTEALAADSRIPCHQRVGFDCEDGGGSSKERSQRKTKCAIVCLVTGALMVAGTIGFYFLGPLVKGAMAHTDQRPANFMQPSPLRPVARRPHIPQPSRAFALGEGGDMGIPAMALGDVYQSNELQDKDASSTAIGDVYQPDEMQGQQEEQSGRYALLGAGVFGALGALAATASVAMRRSSVAVMRMESQSETTSGNLSPRTPRGGRSGKVDMFLTHDDHPVRVNKKSALDVLRVKIADAKKQRKRLDYTPNPVMGQLQFFNLNAQRKKLVEAVRKTRKAQLEGNAAGKIPLDDISGVDPEEWDPRLYPYDPRIHNTGNDSYFHADVAPLFTWFTDVSVYGRNLRQSVIDAQGEGKTILDMGCGTGYSTSRTPGSLGIDTSAPMLYKAKKRWPVKQFLEANMEYWIPDKTYDVITSMFCFHEIPQASRKRIIENAIKHAGEKVVIVDIAPTYKPKEVMVKGEPYILEYLENIQEDMASYGFKETVLEEGHVHSWTYEKIDGSDSVPQQVPKPYKFWPGC